MKRVALAMGLFVAVFNLGCEATGGGHSRSPTSPEAAATPPEGTTTPPAATGDPATPPGTDPATGTDPDPAEPPEHGTAPDPLIDISTLTKDELSKVQELRAAIEHGLDIGRGHYLDTVSLVLQDHDVTGDWEAVMADAHAGLETTPEPCPFAKFYDNGFEPTGASCEYLTDLAKVDAYAKLTQALDAVPSDAEKAGPHPEEALFWREQGAQSGIEEQRVVVRVDLGVTGLCNTKPTAVESSATKGDLVGRQLFASRVNAWLAAKGITADYPTMSAPMQVCNLNTAMLDPVRKEAHDLVDETVTASPLCANYEPPTQEGKMHYSQATLDYATHIEKGIDDEYAIAAVKVFKVVSCVVADPIVVDLDRDGVELLPVHRGVNFDLWASGRAIATAWPAADDGLLVLDRDGDGAITSGRELFGNMEGASDGFAALGDLDADGDGVLTDRDPAFSALRVWHDRDSDALTDAGELLTLAELGVTALPLAATPVSEAREGSVVAAVTQADAAGGVLLVADVLLRTAPWPHLR